MRALQALIDKAEFEVRQGTPQDIASRGLFEACAEMIEGHEDAEHRAEEAETEVDDYEKAVEELRKNVKTLLDENVGYGDPEPGDILDAYKTLAQEIDELRAKAKAKDARIEDLGKQLVTAEARLRELEPAGEERAALIERTQYLESGLKRLMLDAYKLRKRAL